MFGENLEMVDMIAVLYLHLTRIRNKYLCLPTLMFSAGRKIVSRRRVSLVSPLIAKLGRHHNALHIQFPVFKSDTQVLFSFSLYQTEYDNVSWELLDEKIFMVPSAFFFFAQEMNWTVGTGFGTNTACIIMKSSSFSIQRSSALKMEFANQIGLEMVDIL